jgi:phenylacetate-CoA ligase
MQIGKAGAPVSHISQAYPDRVEVRGRDLVKPQAAGTKQDPPLPVSVELAHGATADAALAESIRDRLRDVLLVQTRVDLVPWGSLRRSDYKSSLVER